MSKIIFLAVMLIKGYSAYPQLNLSPVNTGDCVAPRIQSERTAYMDEYDKKYCAQNKDKKKEMQCLKNAKMHTEFSFFTDRCSEKEYYIGINGEEISLRRISKKPGKPTDFIGMFSGNGIRVVISNPRLIAKTDYGEEDLEGGSYKVDVTVTKGKLTKRFKDMTFSYGL